MIVLGVLLVAAGLVAWQLVRHRSKGRPEHVSAQWLADYHGKHDG